MRELVYYIATTLDGFIAGPEGSFDFFPGDDTPGDDTPGDGLRDFADARFADTIPTHVRARLGIDPPRQRFDTAVMGRGTYQPALDIGVGSPYAHLRQYVVSSTLPPIADPGVELVADDPLGLVRRLKAEEGGDIWLVGGGTLAGRLLPEIDEIAMKRYPVAIGSGIPMIAGGFGPHTFEAAEHRAFDSGAVVSIYRRR
ncbi:dihydrofolate reductase family protein [Nocardiopsis mangrovi]|uniref:Dihydrofolate reductase family protein n=1 Tax=Nocardiopsis mangrovi TaxID=1179818 RepID=A0ABV9DXZ7_9ACTN